MVTGRDGTTGSRLPVMTEELSQRLDPLPVAGTAAQRLCVMTGAAPAEKQPVRSVLRPVLATQLHGRDLLRR